MKITHPYFTEENDEEQKVYREVVVKWDGEILDGVPHGLGYLSYNHKEEDKNSEEEDK